MTARRTADAERHLFTVAVAGTAEATPCYPNSNGTPRVEFRCWAHFENCYRIYHEATSARNGTGGYLRHRLPPKNKTIQRSHCNIRCEGFIFCAGSIEVGHN